MLFSRAGFTGAQAFPAHWAGDEDSTWAAYRASLTAGLSAGLSGIGYWSWDIAGFSGPIPSSELFQRGTAMGAFSPIMQYHSEHNEHRVPSVDRTPWNIAEQTGDPAAHNTYRWFARVRMNLIPYLEAVGLETAQSGMPMLRAMLLHFPKDPVAARIDDQYLLGPDLIVAPVLEEGTTSRRVYIPEGSWWSLWSGVRYQPGWHDVSAAVDEIPVFVRGGVAIPLWLGDDGLIGSPVDLPGEGRGHPAVMVFPGTAGSELVYWSHASLNRIGAKVHDGQLTVTGHVESPHVLWLRGGADGDSNRDVSGDFVETLAL
jgi:alpha-glucosidase (family GH31 glycosyl hydrolase)